MSVRVRPWADVRADLAADWQQGQHVAILGPTGTGKTFLISELFWLRSYCLALVTKQRDKEWHRLQRLGVPRTGVWPPGQPADRMLVWPSTWTDDIAADLDGQAELYSAVLGDVWRRGGWSLFLDEVSYVHDTLNLRRQLSPMWLQGRSEGITVIAGSQRPAYVPSAMLSQSRFVFIGPEREAQNLKRLREIGGVDSKAVGDAVRNLSGREFLMVDNHSRTLTVTRAHRTRVHVPSRVPQMPPQQEPDRGMFRRLFRTS